MPPMPLSIPTLMVVRGIGGIGKPTLAVSICKDAKVQDDMCNYLWLLSPLVMQGFSNIKSRVSRRILHPLRHG
ncbi:hypothetical protein GOP47_0004158 [Adiantum capillus-veneris]|uniref:NB-ARC domain-containing protein n=1 Tax=Adiantum capillus-veneris TaxID=13818 RepID=A0A9D4V7Q2_ADICA|nr:hypothetical protein GOP47_0004158 [Adiantum capillus-veneris]